MFLAKYFLLCCQKLNLVVTLVFEFFSQFELLSFVTICHYYYRQVFYLCRGNFRQALNILREATPYQKQPLGMVAGVVISVVVLLGRN